MPDARFAHPICMHVLATFIALFLFFVTKAYKAGMTSCVVSIGVFRDHRTILCAHLEHDVRGCPDLNTFADLSKCFCLHVFSGGV